MNIAVVDCEPVKRNINACEEEKDCHVEYLLENAVHVECDQSTLYVVS